MTQTNIANVRRSLRITDTDMISDEDITGYIADAVEQINVTDEQAERYLTCWLIAEDFSWDKVKSQGGTTFETPKPQKFEDKYMFRLKQLGQDKPKKVNWEVSDNEEY